MAVYQLKGYQSNCLNVLSDFLRRARTNGAKVAFNESDSRPLDALKRRSKYALIPSWPESEVFPYVWAQRSAGRCLFALVGKDDMEARLDQLLALAPT